MDKINLLILFLLCASTTATNSTLEKPDISNNTAQAKLKNARLLQGSYNWGGQYGGIPPIMQWQQQQSQMQGSPLPQRQPQQNQILKQLMHILELQLELLLKLQQQIPTIGTGRPQIGNEYEVHPTGSYKYHPELLTWDESRMVCESEGAHLAIINSKREADVLVKIFTTSPNQCSKDHIYLGFYDKNGKGLYGTIEGEKLEDAGYARWKLGQPDNPGIENCGSMHISGQLNDIQCTNDKVPFICEKSDMY